VQTAELLYIGQMLNLSDRELKKIIARRDPRYDGRFYFGVKTTKIYCRPVCPAKPKSENILIFRSPSEAEQMGYRPCKRCRPDMFPGQKSLDEKYMIVGRALELIETTQVIDMDSLANSLNITSRHLRRLFSEYLGASPLSILNTKRLHLAKKFLIETDKTVTEIAFAVGFNSLRRFNEAFKKLYQATPSTIRKMNSSVVSSGNTLTLEIFVRKPYDWQYVLHYLDKHLIFGSEQVRENKYIRFVSSEKESVGVLKATYIPKKGSILLECSGLSLLEIKNFLPKFKKLFDVDHNPTHLPTKNESKKGVRVPTSFENYEVAISIILGQLISTKQAKKKLEELVLEFGTRTPNDNIDREVIFFPTPQVLSKAKIEKIGLTRIKASAIRELSRKIVDEEIELTYLKDIEITKKKLLEIKGIGPWTVELIAMRCLGDVKAFPASDLFIRRALEQGLIDDEKWEGMKSYLCHLTWRDLGDRLSK